MDVNRLSPPVVFRRSTARRPRHRRPAAEPEPCSTAAVRCWRSEHTNVSNREAAASQARLRLARRTGSTYPCAADRQPVGSQRRRRRPRDVTLGERAVRQPEHAPSSTQSNTIACVSVRLVAEHDCGRSTTPASRSTTCRLVVRGRRSDVGNASPPSVYHCCQPGDSRSIGSAVTAWK